MCLALRLAFLSTASLMAPSVSSNTSTAPILIDGSMIFYTWSCLKSRNSFTAFDKATYSTSEAPDAVTPCNLECQLTASFTSIYHTRYRASCIQASSKIRISVRFHVESTALPTMSAPAASRFGSFDISSSGACSSSVFERVGTPEEARIPTCRFDAKRFHHLLHVL